MNQTQTAQRTWLYFHYFVIYNELLSLDISHLQIYKWHSITKEALKE